MKALVKRILFKNRTGKNFPAVRIDHDEVREKVFLVLENHRLDITSNHCIVCQTPFYLAAWLTEEQFALVEAKIPKVEISVNDELVARLKISFKQTISDAANYIVIFHIDDAQCYQLNKVHQYFLQRYFQNKATILEGKIYSAMYSYPRRVISVAYQDRDYYNIFPMDFQCFTSNGTYILGLRTTNVTIKKIIESKKVVIADTDAARLETIYYLGSHHSNTPPSLHKLPFKTVPSEMYQFPVPDFAASYKEVEIVENYELGSHMLMIGKVKNSKQLRKGNSSLYHIHFFQLFKSNYTEA
ncbi:MAG: hypothetical protein ACOYXT_25715 [Bacteroidota bacterium]